MMAGCADLVSELGAENVRLDGRAIRMERKLDEPRIRFRVLPERDDAGNLRLFRAAHEMGELRVVAVEHGGAAVFQPEKNLRLGVGDFGERPEKLQMHRRYRSDQNNVRACQ